MEAKISRLSLKGYKSIADAAIDFRDLNVLIGANGSGKSNLLSFFQMLSAMLSSPMGGLRRYAAINGGAAAMLCDGPKATSEIWSQIDFTERGKAARYEIGLALVGQDRFSLAFERLRRGADETAPLLLHDGAHDEPDAVKFTLGRDENACGSIFRSISFYQFHDTSANSPFKLTCDAFDGARLRHDGGNLAPFLLGMRDNRPKYYRRIVETIRQMAPFFDDFVLEPQYDKIMLRWRESDSEVVFSAHQASDGLLRMMAMVTALLQPPEVMPALLIFDEPELGLHPHAIIIVGGLIKAAAVDRQVIVATQSPLLLDQFDPQDVIIADRAGRTTSFHRLDPEQLAEWLEDYTLGDLWHKNVLGGQPESGPP